MSYSRFLRIAGLLCCLTSAVAPSLSAAEAAVPSREAAMAAMKRASRFMREKVAVHGGYVWSYLPDLSRRWGEIEARPQMIWVQAPGTVQVGHMFLNAYQATGDEEYYQAAADVAKGLIEGQLPAGGWNYVIDFAGEQDLRQWYETVGRNAWRLEEYQHYYGNATFDDSVTADATRYLLRFHLEKRDATAKAALDRAIGFILSAQHPNGGWPQRFPRAGEFHHGGRPDYTGLITFNDNVTVGNIELLVQCHHALRDPRLLAAIRRGMDVVLATQGRPPQAGWSLQHSLDLKPAGARSYEPPSLATHATAANVRALLKFYRLTGDRRYLARIPDTLAWLEAVKLPESLRMETGRTHPTFVELGTNAPLYLHRTGSNVVNGRYYADHDPRDTVGHYSSFREVDLPGLNAEYAAVGALAPEVATARSPLLHPDVVPVFPKRGGEHEGRGLHTAPARAGEIISSLDPEGRWLTPLRTTSHLFTRDGSREITPGDYRTTLVGDDTDTSPYIAPDPVPGISTHVFVQHMNELIAYVAAGR